VPATPFFNRYSEIIEGKALTFEEVETVISKAEAKLVVLLCHQNADPDALGSVYAFAQLLKKTHPLMDVEVSPAKGMSKISGEILKVIPMNITTAPRIEAADVIFLLDTSTVEQLGLWKSRVKHATKPIIVIDHHATHPETKELAHLAIIQEDISSTCEIVYEMFKQKKIRPKPLTAQALFLGIAFDTQRFRLANSTTFKAIAELIDFDVDPKEVLSLLMTPLEYSEKVSRLKAAKRLKIIKISDWLIAISHVSSYQSSAARALLGVGAHVAVVWGNKGEEFRISLRSSRDFYRKTGVHLGRDIAKPLGDYINGMGGGHSTAAGANGTGEFTTVSEKCITLLQDKLNKCESNQL
jgi:nanoRNase/pAp phosphatase (c-di-AMP/oligoRNAs hydrolase)